MAFRASLPVRVSSGRASLTSHFLPSLWASSLWVTRGAPLGSLTLAPWGSSSSSLPNTLTGSLAFSTRASSLSGRGSCSSCSVGGWNAAAAACLRACARKRHSHDTQEHKIYSRLCPAGHRHPRAHYPQPLGGGGRHRSLFAHPACCPARPAPQRLRELPVRDFAD